MLETMMISLGVIVGIAVIAICAFFICTHNIKCCKNNSQQTSTIRLGDEQAPQDMTVMTDNHGNILMIDGGHDGISGGLHWKPPDYDQVANLPSYEEAMQPKSNNQSNKDTVNKSFQQASRTKLSPRRSKSTVEPSTSMELSEVGVVNEAFTASGEAGGEDTTSTISVHHTASSPIGERHSVDSSVDNARTNCGLNASVSTSDSDECHTPPLPEVHM